MGERIEQCTENVLCSLGHHVDVVLRRCSGLVA
jgi:hypothetical protein